MPELQGSDQEDIKVALRKLRKRLRQIESLEKLTRPLTSEEIEKVSTKILIDISYIGAIVNIIYVQLTARINMPQMPLPHALYHISSSG